jgi:lipoprotein-releasing system permease protein
MNNRLSLFIARRYFFSKKSQRVINIISMISAIGVTIGTAALIIVLSVFNGFEDLILRLYNSFDPDLRIELLEGKTFTTDKINIEQLKNIAGVAYVTEVAEESVLAKYHNKQLIVKLKGVSDDYRKMSGLDSMLIDGTFMLKNGEFNYAIVGSGVAYNLGIDLSNIFGQLEIYGARPSATSMTDPEGSFNRRYISPSGIFAIQQEYDAKYIIVPIRFARDVFEYENKLTSLEVGLKPGANEEEVIASINSLVGKNFSVKNRYKQHELFYKIMRSEKWAVFLILTFILIIAIFNVISSLTMLVIEKKKDIAIYRSMGADVHFLRKIFLTEGMIITVFGAVAGLLIGMVFCVAQQQFGLIQLSGSGSFVIDSYPVKMNPKDFIYVFATVCLIGLFASWYPASRLIRDKINLKVIAGEE